MLILDIIKIKFNVSKYTQRENCLHLYMAIFRYSRLPLDHFDTNSMHSYSEDKLDFFNLLNLDKEFMKNLIQTYNQNKGYSK